MSNLQFSNAAPLAPNSSQNADFIPIIRPVANQDALAFQLPLHEIPTAATLSNWFRGGIVGKKIAIFGDSTSDGDSNALGLHITLNGLTQIGQTLEGAVILNFGNNGQNAGGVRYDPGPKGLSALIAANPDLVVLCFGINDVRLGLCDQPTLVTRLRALIDAIRAARPMTDIVLRMPNRLANDPASISNSLSPATTEAAIQYSNLMRNAYLSLANVYPNVVLFDTQKLITGLEDVPWANNAVNGDSVHPSVAYDAIARGLGDLLGVPTPFSPALARLARQKNYSADYLSYSRALEDTDYYDLICQGTIIDSGPGYIRVDFAAPRGLEIHPDDIFRCGDGQVFTLNVAGTDFFTNTQIPQTPPSPFQSTKYAIYRHKFAHSAAIEIAIRGKVAHPYLWGGHSGYGGNGGNNIIQLHAKTGELPSLQRTATAQSDTLLFADGTAFSLNDATFEEFQGHLSIRKPGADFAPFADKNFVVYGPHLYENGTRFRQLDPDIKGFQVN